MKSLATITALSALLILAVAVPESHAGRRSRGDRGKNSGEYSSNSYGTTQWTYTSSPPSSYHTVYYQPTPAKPLYAGGFVPVVVDQRPVAASRLVPTKVSTTTVPPTLPAANRPLVVPGSQVVLSGNYLGDTPGTVTMQMNNMTLPVEVVNWTAAAATVRVPAMTLNSTTAAMLSIVRPDGSIARTIEVSLPAGVTGRL